jgi:hypothetical protein
VVGETVAFWGAVFRNGGTRALTLAMRRGAEIATVAMARKLAIRLFSIDATGVG